MQDTRIMLAAADSFVRLGLRTLLSVKGLTIVGEAAGPLDAILKASVLQPDIVVLDLSFQHGNGPITLRELTLAAPNSRLIVLSDRHGEAFVEQALMSGASAYLLKQTATAELGWAIQAVSRGREFFSPALISILRGNAVTIPEPDQFAGLPPLGLSPTEAQLMVLIKQGAIIKQMAQDLCAHIKTLRQDYPQATPRHRKSTPGWTILRRLFIAIQRGPQPQVSRWG